MACSKHYVRLEDHERMVADPISIGLVAGPVARIVESDARDINDERTKGRGILKSKQNASPFPYENSQ